MAKGWGDTICHGWRGVDWISFLYVRFEKNVNIVFLSLTFIPPYVLPWKSAARYMAVCELYHERMTIKASPWLFAKLNRSLQGYLLSTQPRRNRELDDRKGCCSGSQFPMVHEATCMHICTLALNPNDVSHPYAHMYTLRSRHIPATNTTCLDT